MARKDWRELRDLPVDETEARDLARRAVCNAGEEALEAAASGHAYAEDADGFSTEQLRDAAREQLARRENRRLADEANALSACEREAERAREEERQEWRRRLAVFAEPEDEDTPPEPVFVSASDHRQPMAWTVDRVLPRVGAAQMWGASYTGKSFLAIDFGLRIANGLPEWFGHPISGRGKVLYVALEGFEGIGERVEAWVDAHPGTWGDDLLVTEGPLDLTSRQSCKAFCASTRREVGMGVALVVIDSQAMAIGGADENSNSVMAAVFGNLQRMARVLQCAVMTVHHAGHDTSRARGASAQKAALDLEIQVDAGRWRAVKVKESTRTDWHAFRLEPSGESVWAAPGAEPTPEERVLALLRAEPWEHTKTSVLTAVGRGQAVKEAFAALEDAGEIRSENVTRPEGARAVQRVVWGLS